MVASDNISPQQFGKYRIRYTGVGKPGGPEAGAHRVEVRLGRQRVGGMSWRAEGSKGYEPGEIDDIKVNHEHRRKGVATAMYNYAVASGIEPAPQHSPARSIAGDAWAYTTKGYVPPLRDDE
jgi:GNAT superfamily N-acetyltransferase